MLFYYSLIFSNKIRNLRNTSYEIKLNRIFFILDNYMRSSMSPSDHTFLNMLRTCEVRIERKKISKIKKY